MHNRTLKITFTYIVFIALDESLAMNTALGFISSYVCLPLDSHLKLFISYKLAMVTVLYYII